MIKLYTLEHCIKCMQLKNLFKQKKVAYEEVKDFNIEDMKTKGFFSAPILEIDGNLMGFDEAKAWILAK